MNRVNFEEWRKNAEGKIKVLRVTKINGDFVARLSRHPEQKKNFMIHTLNVEETKQYVNGTLDSYLNGGKPYQYEHYWEEKKRREEEERNAERERRASIRDRARKFEDIEEGDTVYDANYEEIGCVLDTFCAKFNQFVILNKVDEYGDYIMVRYSHVYVVA